MGFFKKKYILTSAVFFAVTSVLSAKNFSFNLIPYFAVETSVIEEAYYYEDYSKYADEMCSLLEWEQKPSYIFGLEGIFNQIEIFLLNSKRSQYYDWHKTDYFKRNSPDNVLIKTFDFCSDDYLYSGLYLQDAN